eukprot:jgi/Botrbrau1/4672/Bobra.33_2s0037.2
MASDLSSLKIWMSNGYSNHLRTPCCCPSPTAKHTNGPALSNYKQQLRLQTVRRTNSRRTYAPSISYSQRIAEDSRGPSTSSGWHSAAGGSWVVRPIRPEEVAEVAGLQARAFHDVKPFGILDALQFYLFHGEVLSGLHQKLKYSRDEGFCCLVAQKSSGSKDIIGVVEVSVQGDKAELDALAKSGFEDDSYAYVACMAVGDEWRRQGVASALLTAAEKVACKWMQTWVVLHVYIDNTPGELLLSSHVPTPL